MNNFSHFFDKYKHILDNPQPKNPENYDEICNTEFSIYSRTTDSFKNYCIKFMKYLRHLDECSDENYQKGGIIYLYLLLQYYEIHNKIKNGNTLEIMKKMVNSLEKIHNDVNIATIYNNNMERILNDKLNDLFYLYEKIDNFHMEQEIQNNKCIYAKECVEMYKSSINKCNTNSNKYLCSELENFRNKFNNNNPFAKDCPKLDSYLPSYKNYSTSVIILISFITISVLSSLLFILFKVITIFIYLFIVQ
ncbi:hypothetical protein PVBG_05671 [Plasmodium vivax Brazil I]|uniref:Variable surface protein n=1 Tax=Plasmodium vivax (strain Brazil I) TaxID=1033975 RepID=A0A0J9SZY9_PLAV1|nr:hypothetical protein PVBG_05671 [Plasmodium vivax Brazil I]